MRDGWETKPLADVCLTIQDGAHESPKVRFDAPGEGRFPYITSKNIRTNYLDLENVSYVDRTFQDRIYPRCQPSVGDVLLTKDGANTGNVTLNTLDEPFSLLSSVCLIKTDPAALSPSFLSYYIQSPDGLISITGQMSGAAIRRIILRDIKRATIPLPPLAEQQRIVSILDEAFRAIATAKANAGRNLQNARALFESHLQSVFAQHGGGWVEQTVGECFRVRSGDFLPTKAMVESGDFDVFGGNGIAGRHDRKNLTGENIVIGRVGAKCGNVRHVHGDLWLTDNAFYISEYSHAFDLGFLARLLELTNLRRTANQAAQPVISYKTIKDVILRFPVSAAEQSKIAWELDGLETEVRRLESIYLRKLAALEELKKSLLHVAFTGQL